jgi:ech hydrogenase subunit D
LKGFLHPKHVLHNINERSDCMEKQTLKVIDPKDLLDVAMKHKEEGYRLVAITCTNKEGMELSYSFDRSYDFITCRFVIELSVEIESITDLYPYAFLYENEIKELFGVKIKNIGLDFHNNLYQISVKTPFQNSKEKE